MKGLIEHYRGPEQWQELGLPMSCDSDEACQMYDAVLTQYVGWYEDDSVGGFLGAIQKMMAADITFVMGHVIKNGLELMATGTSCRFDEELSVRMEQIKSLLYNPTVNQWEKQHISALYSWSQGNLYKACTIWEDILVDKPKDMLALKFAHDTYFYLGLRPQMRDSVARVLPHWNSTIPLYGYLHGMLAFGQEETNLYDQAEKSAMRALEINRHDAWATHAISHVNEMLGRQTQGVNFLERTEDDWSGCELLACHNYWHWALHHIEKGHLEEALDIYDNQIAGRSRDSGAMLDLVDRASLLYRLQLEGVNVRERWEDSYKFFRSHLSDHILAFNDAHVMMCCMGADQDQAGDKLLDSLQDYIENDDSEMARTHERVGYKLCKALKDYKNEDYAAVVDSLRPVKYDIHTIGGSNAQRDVFNLLLIWSAIKSPNKQHKKVARNLIAERKSLKPNSCLTDRLMSNWLAAHQD
ncbi:tetratricopeptide repeat protein 38-like [Argonauta hians]